MCAFGGADMLSARAMGVPRGHEANALAMRMPCSANLRHASDSE